MRISDWSSDVCSSDLLADVGRDEASLTRLPDDIERTLRDGCRREHISAVPWVEGCRSRGEGHLGIGDLPHATGILCEGLTQADPGQQAAIGPVDSLQTRGDEGHKGYIYTSSQSGPFSLVLQLEIPTHPLAR